MLPTSDNTTSQLATVAAGIASPDERRHFLMESFNKKSSQSYQTTDPLLVAGLEHDPEAMAMEPNARNAVGSAAGNLAARDPAQAWEWARTLPAGPLQETSVASLTEAWLAKSPEDASAWAGSLPAGPLRDAAAESIVRRTLTDDPERAAAWAGTIQNPTLRAKWQAAITSGQQN